jgi:hypothetical protein
MWSRWRGASRLGHPSHCVPAEAAGEDRRSQCFEVRVTRQSVVESFDPSGGIEQQRRSVTSSSSRKHDLSAQSRQPRVLKLVQRTDLRSREER